jgi:hypothetical protein
MDIRTITKLVKLLTAPVHAETAAQANIQEAIQRDGRTRLLDMRRLLGIWINV